MGSSPVASQALRWLWCMFKFETHWSRSFQVTTSPWLAALVVQGANEVKVTLIHQDILPCYEHCSQSQEWRGWRMDLCNKLVVVAWSYIWQQQVGKTGWIAPQNKGMIPFMCQSMPLLSQSSLVLTFLGLNFHSGSFKQLSSVSFFLALSV